MEGRLAEYCSGWLSTGPAAEDSDVDFGRFLGSAAAHAQFCELSTCLCRAFPFAT